MAIRDNLRQLDGNERAALGDGDLIERRGRPIFRRPVEEAPPDLPPVRPMPIPEVAPAVPPLLPVEPLPWRPPFIPLEPRPLPPPVPRTVTQLAQGAANQLRATDRAVLEEALTTVRNSSVGADGLMYYLERKVLIGEVLNRLAENWAADVKQDFAAAFSMGADRLAVMDAIVSIAILNDPDLVRELRAENMPPPTQDDLLERRRVVAQEPPAGTPVVPGQLVLVAVEYQETTRAEEVVQSIIGDLTDHQGFKLPAAAAQKLR